MKGSIFWFKFGPMFSAMVLCGFSRQLRLVHLQAAGELSCSNPLLNVVALRQCTGHYVLSSGGYIWAIFTKRDT